MTIKTPGTRNRAATREKLLDAAREVLARDGIQGASVEHICEQAGFSRGAFYSNFASKDELVLAMFNREKTIMFANLQAAVDPAAVGGEDLVSTIDVILERFLSLQPADRDWFLVNAEFTIHGIRHESVGREFNEVYGRTKTEFQEFMVQVTTALGRRLTIDPASAATILMGTYDLALREALIENREVDTVLMRETLPTLLLAMTEPSDAH